MRIRTIKPELWSDQKMRKLTALEKCVFICLVSMSDDEGRIEADADGVQSFGFPRESSREIANALDTLATSRRIIRYENNGNQYIQVVNFSTHQKIDHAKPSKMPAPPDGYVDPALQIRESERTLANKSAVSVSVSGSGSGLEVEGICERDDESAATAAFDTSPTEPIQPITTPMPTPDSKPLEKAEIRVKTLTKYLYATYAEKSDIRLSRVALRALKNPPIHELELVERAMRDNPDLDVDGLSVLFEWVMSNKHWRLKANDPAAFARHIIQITRDHASRRTIEKENDDGG